MAKELPIRFQELAQLQNVGISAEAIGFNTLTMESDKFICVRETGDQGSNVVIIDLANPTQPMRKPMSADSAMMNPMTKVIALKSGQHLQIYNIEMKSRMKTFEMSEAVTFWKWIDVKTVGLITENAVYHWSMEGQSEPVKIFDRHDTLQGTQIIHYRVSADKNWCVLVGIKAVDGRIVGQMQLYSVERKVSQALEGHCATFARFKAENQEEDSTLFAFAARGANGAKLMIIEVGAQTQRFQKVTADIFFPQDAAADFPISLQVSETHGVLFLITKMGYIHLYDIQSGTVIYVNRISTDPIFIAAPHVESGGIVCISKKGQVLFVAIDEDNIVRYCLEHLNNLKLSTDLAGRANLPGGETLFQQQFDRLFNAADYKAAAECAANSPQSALRNTQTIQRFAQIPVQPGQTSPLLQYFGILLGKGTLNDVESVELVKPVLQQGRKELLEKWLKENKLECSEELGDLVRQHDMTLALSVYLRAEVPKKVVACFAETGSYDKIVVYAQKVNYTPDYPFLLQTLAASNPQGTLQFAQLLVAQDPPLMEIGVIADILLSRQLLQETTSFLLDALKENKPEHAALQTKLLEINLISAPQVADAILGNEMFSHYDRERVAMLCEKAQLYQRALDHYTDMDDIKRNIVNAGPDFLLAYFARIESDEDFLGLLGVLLATNLQQNMQTVVQIVSKYWPERIGPIPFIELFEKYKAGDGLFFFLGGILSTSDEPEVHFKYIEVAAKLGHFKEVEKCVRDSNAYEPERVKEFLKTTKLADQLPLIIVCDRFGFIDDLTKHLYENQMMKYIEIYVQKVNPMRTPDVLAALIDVDCSEEFMKNLIMSVKNMVPVAELIQEVQKRNRMKLLLPWLEARASEGAQDPELHSALAMCYVDSNNNPEHYLRTNQFYDSKEVGKYCEKRDPQLAVIAYERGLCDQELIAVCNANSLFKQEARYLVERQDLELWATVLQEEDENRRDLIDQLVQTVLPECKNPEEVSLTVKAFMTANLPNELIELLEKIVLEPNASFANNQNLQNLLLLTAIKADKARVMDYIQRLDNYEPEDIANIAVGAELFEEAYTIYKKFDFHVPCVQVLIEHIQDLDRAHEYAEKCNEPDVWSRLAHAQLDNDMVIDAMESYKKAEDPSLYVEVTNAAHAAQAFEELVAYLQMARKKLKEAYIETELCFAFAKTDRLADLEEFVSSPNIAQIQNIGDRCFNNGLFEAAKVLFNNISNFSRLASCLVKLEQYQGAVDAARKASSTRTWKEVVEACVDAKEFRLAQICGLHIIIHADELEDLVDFYETRGHFEELISVMEAGLGLERAHSGVFTTLTSLYSKYKPEKLMEHLKLFWGRLNLAKCIKVVNSNQQWPELCFLYQKYDEWDNAALVMLNHPSAAFEHLMFLDSVVKVANLDIYYKAITFYLETLPLKLNDLLQRLSPRIDHTRVIQIMRKAGHLPLVKRYIESVQENNLLAVNEAFNEICIDEEQYDRLRTSIDEFDQYDAIALAQRCEQHELLEFRRIGSYLFKKNQRWEKSIELSKKDNLFKDAMETAAESLDINIAENLLRYFVEIGAKDCFAACLFTCYKLIRPDVALEVAWKAQLTDCVMPYMIQSFRDVTTKIDMLVKDKEEREQKKEEGDEVAPDNVHGFYPAIEYAPPDPTYMQQPYGGGFVQPQPGFFPPQ